MNWIDVETAFNRAIALSCSRAKLLLAFPVLVLCGVLTVFCRAIAYDASDWVAFSLAFLPFFLSSGLLLALGALLAKIHYHEVKGLSLNFRRMISGSSDLMIGTSYLSIPPVLIYLLLWIAMGLFFLLKEIPAIGDFFSVVLSFAPFLLIFSSFLLCLFNLGLLFFVAPAAALQPIKRVSLAKRVFDSLKVRSFTAIVLFFIAMVPILFLAGLLCFAAMLTNVSFSISERSLSVAMEWFFIMLPFAALLSPAVIFFFNFALESYILLQPQRSVKQ